jgi:hypothetical protein
MILSFSWTTPALLAGQKTITRRTWKPQQAAKFHAGDLVDAWDHVPRVKGARKVATIRITRDPYIQNSRELDEEDYAREGFAYLDAHPETDGHKLARFGGHSWRDAFEEWRRSAEDCWVIEFRLVAEADADGGGAKPASASTNDIGSGLTRDQAALIRDAFPTNDAGAPRCGHCGGPRKELLKLCFRCWRRLSTFVQVEILRSPTRLEKAQLIVQTRPASTRVPSSTTEDVSGGTRVAAAEAAGGGTP